MMQRMMKVEIKTEKDPHALAELISAVNGQPAADASVKAAGEKVREAQEQGRPSWADAATVNFATLDEENDWSDV
jgi:hypothetical protein